MVKQITTTVVLFTALSAGIAHGYDCSGVPVYSDKASYSEGDVTDSSNDIYRCDVGGLCKQGGPYAPGLGWAWEEAWTRLGACSGNGKNPPVAKSADADAETAVASDAAANGNSCSGLESWNPGAQYTEGTLIQYNGKIYQTNWWSQGDNPAQNSESWQVWRLISQCDNSLSGNAGHDAADHS